MSDRTTFTNTGQLCLPLSPLGSRGNHLSLWDAKTLGWFDDFGGGVGIKASLAQFKKKKIPQLFAWMVIIGQSLGSILLIIGFSGRIAAAGNFIIFTGALINHLPDGWVMNWIGRKRGEGIEYFVLLLSILLIIIIKGSGAMSVDIWLRQMTK